VDGRRYPLASLLALADPDLRSDLIQAWELATVVMLGECPAHPDDSTLSALVGRVERLLAGREEISPSERNRLRVLTARLSVGLIRCSQEERKGSGKALVQARKSLRRTVERGGSPLGEQSAGEPEALRALLGDLV
jgi:hypothetical protein